jgi:hypothetical protein
MTTAQEYVYAGFIYIVTQEDGRPRLRPKPGQHPAANKDRHVRAATECYLEEQQCR